MKDLDFVTPVYIKAFNVRYTGSQVYYDMDPEQTHTLTGDSGLLDTIYYVDLDWEIIADEAFAGRNFDYEEPDDPYRYP